MMFMPLDGVNSRLTWNSREIRQRNANRTSPSAVETYRAGAPTRTAGACLRRVALPDSNSSGNGSCGTKARRRSRSASPLVPGARSAALGCQSGAGGLIGLASVSGCIEFVLILRSPDGARAARPHASNARAAFRRPIDLAKESSHRAHDWRDDGFRAAGEASRALRIQLPLAARAAPGSAERIRSEPAREPTPAIHSARRRAYGSTPRITGSPSSLKQ